MELIHPIGAGAVLATLAASCAALSLLRLSVAVPPIAHPERSALADAGLAIGAARWELLRVAATVTAALLCLVWSLPIVLAGLAVAAQSVWLRVRGDAARARGRRGATRAMRLVHAALRSGTMLPDAVRRAIDGIADPLASRPLRRALEAFSLGHSLDESLRAAAADSDRRWRDVLETLALGVAERLPVDRLAVLVEHAAERLAFEDQIAGEVAARASGARLQVWILACMVPALTAYLALTVPALAEVLLGPLGTLVLLPAATALEVAGVVLSREAIRGAA